MQINNKPVQDTRDLANTRGLLDTDSIVNDNRLCRAGGKPIVQISAYCSVNRYKGRNRARPSMFRIL